MKDHAGPLLVGTSFIDSFYKGIFTKDHCIILIQSHQSVFISEYTPLSGLLTVLQRELSVETNTDDQQYNRKKTLLFRVAKFVKIPANAGASVSVTTSRAGVIYMPPYQKLR